MRPNLKFGIAGPLRRRTLAANGFSPPDLQWRSSFHELGDCLP
ncbi:hypothetical protein SAMCCGM7_pC1456 (plasmid) [Sinorhizobium americanum CCGM7]|nr:hypothetical protein SAMCCGM7_pC1456 [Sinorhizobium americanum CCGM7]